MVVVLLMELNLGWVVNGLEGLLASCIKLKKINKLFNEESFSVFCDAKWVYYEKLNLFANSL